MGACLLMFAILCAFDSAFHSMQLATCALQWQTTNEELRLCLLLFQQAITESCPSLHLSAHIMCSSGDPKTVLHNLHWGDLLSLRLFPAETVINLHWLSHQAHSTCAPAHLNPTDESTGNKGHTAVWLMTAQLFSSSFQLILCFYFRCWGFRFNTFI